MTTECGHQTHYDHDHNESGQLKRHYDNYSITLTTEVQLCIDTAIKSLILELWVWPQRFQNYKSNIAFNVIVLSPMPCNVVFIDCPREFHNNVRVKLHYFVEKYWSCSFMEWNISFVYINFHYQGFFSLPIRPFYFLLSNSGTNCTFDCTVLILFVLGNPSYIYVNHINVHTLHETYMLYARMQVILPFHVYYVPYWLSEGIFNVYYTLC